MAEGVGMRAEGLLRFPSAGTWTLVAMSNDGVNVARPTESSCRTATFTQRGWYRLSSTIFQRRNTWALQLYWIPPGGKDPVLIPAEAYAQAR